MRAVLGRRQIREGTEQAEFHEWKALDDTARAEEAEALEGDAREGLRRLRRRTAAAAAATVILPRKA